MEIDKQAEDVLVEFPDGSKLPLKWVPETCLREVAYTIIRRDDAIVSKMVESHRALQNRLNHELKETNFWKSQYMASQQETWQYILLWLFALIGIFSSFVFLADLLKGIPQ